jgi:hypothetical protein
MNEFENIVVGKSSIPSLAITVVCMIAIPVVFLVFGGGTIKDRLISAT